MNTFDISLENVRLYAFHGVMPQENKIGNEFTVDLDVKIEASKLESDFGNGYENLESTISYAEIYEIVRTEMQIPSQLLETVAVRIANRLNAQFGKIISGKIRICKIAPPIPRFTGSASVTYHWSNQ